MCIKVYSAKNNSKLVRTSNIIKKSIAVGSTPMEDSQNSIKASLKIGSVIFP